MKLNSITYVKIKAINGHCTKLISLILMKTDHNASPAAYQVSKRSSKTGPNRLPETEQHRTTNSMETAKFHIFAENIKNLSGHNTLQYFYDTLYAHYI